MYDLNRLKMTKFVSIVPLEYDGYGFINMRERVDSKASVMHVWDHNSPIMTAHSFKPVKEHSFGT